jgi:hypothetical protein
MLTVLFQCQNQFQHKMYLQLFHACSHSDFRDANVNFRAVLAELKREGKGSVDHHPVISDSDLGRIYGYEALHIFPYPPCN